MSRRVRMVQHALEQLYELFATVEGVAADVVRRGELVVYDGYPTSTLGASSYSAHHQGESNDRMGDQIVNQLCPATDYDGTPTGRPARDPDPVATSASELVRHILQALQAMQDAEAACRRANYVPQPERPVEKPTASGCVNCDAYGVFSVAVKAGRCEPCYRYRLRHDLADRPERLVIADQPGRRERERVIPRS